MPSITTNIELIEASKRNRIPLVGVFFKNRLPSVVYDGGYIFNLADGGEGTHWTGAWVEKDRNNTKQVVYFDPFSVAPPENIKHFFRGIDKTIEYSKTQVQNIESFICGYYVIYFLWYMSRMCSYRDEPNIFKRFKNFQRLWSNDVEENRLLLKKYLECLH